MPTPLTPEIAPPSPEPRRKRWTREECLGLEAAGVGDLQRYELIEGDLIDRMGKNSPDVTAVIAITLWLHQVFGAFFVRFEGPIDVSPEDNPTNEPQPDIVVLTREFYNFTSAAPRPADLRLVVEVSDSTLYSRYFPALRLDTVVTVRVEGRPEVHTVEYRRAMQWANRVKSDHDR